MRLFACLPLLVLLVWPAALRAQGAAAPTLAVLDHQVHADGSLDLLLYCADPDLAQAGFTLLGEAGSPLPRPQITPAPTAPGVVIVIDADPSLESDSTPHSTRKRDGLLLAELILTRLPADSPVALISTAALPTIPPVAAGRETIFPALRALVAADFAAIPPADPAHTLALARAQLEAAPVGSRHLAIITARPGAWAAAAPTDDPAIALFDLAGSPSPAAIPEGFAHIPSDPTQSADLPALFTAADDYVDAIAGQHTRIRLKLPPGALPSGARGLTVIGCGGSATVPLTAPAAAVWRWAAALGGLSLAALAGLVLWRNRRRMAPPISRPALPRQQLPRPLTTPFRAAELPTDRQGQGAPANYRLIINRPDGRAAHTLGPGQWAIGRDPACAIAIDHPLISALHARLSIAVDRIEITDLDSTNGTAVGPARRRLAPDAPEPLDLDEIFWLGPEIHAALEAADDAA